MIKIKKSAQEVQNLAEAEQTAASERFESLYDYHLAKMEIPLFKRLLRLTNGNQVSVAKILGIARGTLRTKLAKHNIDSWNFRR